MAEPQYEALVAHIHEVEQELTDLRLIERRAVHELEQQRKTAGRRLTLLKTLHSLNLAVFANLSDTDIYTIASQTVVNQLGWDTCYVVTLAGGRGVVKAHHGAAAQQLAFIQDHFPQNPVLTNAYARREAISTYHNNDADALALRVLFGAEEVMALPILFGDACSGYLVACTNTPGENFNPEETDFLVSLTSLLGHAVQQSTNFFSLEEQNKRLRELDELKDSFISITSHQLRTPLSIIKWILSILQTDKVLAPLAEQKQMIDQAYETNERLIHVVNDLLNVSRIQEGKLPFNPQLSELGMVVRELCTNMQRLYDSKGIHLDLHVPDNMPPVTLDPILFKEAFQNLLDNAMDYNLDRDGWVKVEIATEADRVLLSVTNPGPGIELTEQSRIFEQFYRSPQAVSQHPNGNGLGLYLARAIVEQHSGTLTCVSVPNQETVFTISLPIPPHAV